MGGILLIRGPWSKASSGMGGSAAEDSGRGLMERRSGWGRQSGGGSPGQASSVLGVAAALGTGRVVVVVYVRLSLRLSSCGAEDVGLGWGVLDGCRCGPPFLGWEPEFFPHHCPSHPPHRGCLGWGGTPVMGKGERRARGFLGDRAWQERLPWQPGRTGEFGK